MPELPEVETYRRDLGSSILLREIRSVTITGDRTVRRGPSPPEICVDLKGARVLSSHRWGKYLGLRLRSEVADHMLVLHMGMSGRLALEGVGEPKAKHTKVVLEFQDSKLSFVDPRTFGEIFLAQNSNERCPVELRHLAPDLLRETSSARDHFLEASSKSTVSIKALLLDQRRICGVGNMYADESLFRSRILFSHPSNTLSSGRLEGLFEEVLAVLNEAIEARGSSLRDRGYLDMFGHPGSYQQRHLVYGRSGDECSFCYGPIVSAKYLGRSAFYCPNCQRDD